MYILQITCIFILCFFIILFLMDKNNKAKSRKLLLGLMIVSCAEVLLEMATIYMMSHTGAVSPLTFKIVQRAYLTLVLTFFYVLYMYKAAFVQEETGAVSRNWAFINVAQIILYLGIFILPLFYETEEQGRYVYGPGVWIVYVGAACYMIMVLTGYCEYVRKIAREKMMPLVFSIICGMAICIFYMCVPTSNTSCLGVLIIIIGTYISARSSETVPQGESLEHNNLVEQEEPSGSVIFKAPKAKVLVVDDSMISRKVVVNLLEKTEMQIEEASGGKESLSLAREKQYDLIFMDHLMPEMDGVETVAAMKKEKLCDNTPIVAMTANSDNMSEQEYIDCGFTALVPKPISPQQLSKITYELLDKKLVSYSEFVEMQEEEDDAKTEAQSVPAESDRMDCEGLPAVDGLDYSYASLHFIDTDAFLDTVRFLGTVMLHDAEELDTYFDIVDTEQGCTDFKIKVHSMKNSAMTVGIVPLAGLAKTLEDAAGEQDLDAIRAVYPVFISKWKKYHGLLGQKFAENAGDKISADVDSPEIKELFRSLKNASEEMDIDEMDRIMSRIDAYDFPEEYEEDLSKIRLAVVNFEVEFLQEEGLEKFL